MLQHLRRAHSLFLLHHATTLNDLHLRLPRPSFCTLLDRFWTRFICNWDVLLHGNPAIDIYNGIKLVGGGELGIGVGEEEWGSGEREVLEDYIARTDGLVDLVVSRFGDAPAQPSAAAAGQKSHLSSRHQKAPWLAADVDPRPSDGVLFSGIGAISKRSLATLSQWIADIYKYGEDAYGVRENPTARPRRKKKWLSSQTTQLTKFSGDPNSIERNINSPPQGLSPLPTRSTSEYEAQTPDIPPPLVKVVEQSLENATTKARTREPSSSPNKEQLVSEDKEQGAPLFGTDTMIKYLSLGYGSAWTLHPKGLSKSKLKPDSRRVTQLRLEDKSKEAGSDSERPEEPSPPRLDVIEPSPEISDTEISPFIQRLEQSIGKFLIGLSGELENQDLSEDDTDGGPRIVLRTLTLEMYPPLSGTKREDSMLPSPELTPAPDSFDAPSSESSLAPTHKQLQVAIYVHQPFIFAFLFELHTPSLAYPSFYRSIHHQLGPLQKPLLRSTDPAKVAARIANAMSEGTTTTSTSPGNSNSAACPPIYDLIYDPEKLTIHGSLPNIPFPESLAAQRLAAHTTVSGSWYTLGIPTSSSSSSSLNPTTPKAWSNNTAGTPRDAWTRVEALNVHTQILNTYTATRRLQGELERTVKTGRGWWVLWMRVQGRVNADADDAENRGVPKEAVLVKRAMNDGEGSGGASSGKGGRHVSSEIGWLAREGRRDASGSSAGGGGGGVSSVSEGVGVDARRWVEGLLSLNR
jgi:hypothetical protein